MSDGEVHWVLGGFSRIQGGSVDCEDVLVVLKLFLKGLQEVQGGIWGNLEITEEARGLIGEVLGS